MKLLKRNLTEFEYRAYQGEEEIVEWGKHTGRPEVKYGDPECYKGNIGLPNGFVQNDLFGINHNYTHVLVMDDIHADINEAGLIKCNGLTYEIKAVRRSLNVLSVALKQLTEKGDFVPIDQSW